MEEIERVILDKDDQPMDFEEVEEEDDEAMASLVTQISNLEKTQGGHTDTTSIYE